MSERIFLEISDVPAVSVGVPAETFQELREEYELFRRSDLDCEAILDAIEFDDEEIHKLSTVIGAAAAKKCRGQYVIFYVN